MKFIPNILSMLRLILAFCLIHLVLNNNLCFALVVFAIAAITDFFDGYLARKFSVSSEFGAALDPVADKILMTVSYILFAAVAFIPTYVAVIVVGRDVLILGAVIACKIKKVPLKIRPIMSSKINTTIQLIFLICVLTCKCTTLNIPYSIEVFAVVVVCLTIFSGVEYVQKYSWITKQIFKW